MRLHLTGQYICREWKTWADSVICKQELSKTPSKLMISTEQQTFENHHNFCVQVFTRVCCCSESAVAKTYHKTEFDQRFEVNDEIGADSRTSVPHDMRCFEAEGSLPYCVYRNSSHCSGIYAGVYCRGKNDWGSYLLRYFDLSTTTPIAV